MKLNLGCGSDIRKDCRNVDWRQSEGVDQVVDLSKIPWPWPDVSADEILMLDFLEHFPYSQTAKIIDEAWRVLEPGGHIEVQVPDLDHCAHAALLEPPFMCNRCGYYFEEGYGTEEGCSKCKQSEFDIQDAAVHRLYGGQDYPGNFHFNAFTQGSLERLLVKHGFEDVQKVLRNQHGETFYQNWNIKLRARKADDPWRE